MPYGRKLVRLKSEESHRGKFRVLATDKTVEPSRVFSPSVFRFDPEHFSEEGRRVLEVSLTIDSNAYIIGRGMGVRSDNGRVEYYFPVLPLEIPQEEVDLAYEVGFSDREFLEDKFPLTFNK